MNPELIGKWKLIGTFVSPGGGSVEFESADSQRTIEIFDNGIFKINGPLCGISTTVGKIKTGNVDTINSVLNLNERCDSNGDSEYRFQIEDSYLIIWWTACVEGCAQKYAKLTAE